MQFQDEASANNLQKTQTIQLQRSDFKKNPQARRASYQKGTSNKKKTFDLTATNAKHFEKANWELALKRTKAKMNRYYKGEEVPYCTDLEHFKMYGPGLYLFFRFVRALALVFFMMSFIQLIPVVYNYLQGSGLNNVSSSANLYIAKTTIATFSTTNGSTATDKLMNTIPDMVCMFLFVVFYFYWLYKSGKLTEEVRKEVKLKSYTVVELVSPPKQATRDDVNKFMSQFGRVVQIAEVKDYDETISLSKDIYDLQIQIKELQLRMQQEGQADLQKTIKKKQQQIDQIYKQLVLLQDETKEDILKYYVVFSNIEQRKKALEQIQPHLRRSINCCRDPIPDNYLLSGQAVQMKACYTQPADIIWENQHVTWRTRWLRSLCQYICLLIIVIGGFLFICFLNVVSPSSSSSSVSTTSYTQSSIISENNATIVESWCTANIQTVWTSSSSGLKDKCMSYIYYYILKIAMTIGIALSSVIIKFVMRKVVIFLAKFQRYKSHTEQSKDIIQNLFVTYLFTTIFIIILLQATISGVSFKNAIKYIISNSYIQQNVDKKAIYQDFVPNWYLDIGYQIMLLIIVPIFHPVLSMPFVNWLLEKIQYCRAQGQQIQGKMQKMLQPPEFQIENNYAQIMTLVFISLIMSAGMPLITIVAFFAITFRYIYLKFHFIRFCKIPKTFDVALDNKVTDMLPYALLIHFVFAIWMFGVTDIFPLTGSAVAQWFKTLQVSFFKEISWIIVRVLGTYYYSIFFVLIFVIFFFKMFIYNLVAKRGEAQGQEQTKLVHVQKLNSKQDQDYANTRSFKSICDSYRLENNPDYTEILAIMHEKKKFVVKIKPSN